MFYKVVINDVYAYVYIYMCVCVCSLCVKTMCVHLPIEIAAWLGSLEKEHIEYL